jgi:hypothetical protein
LGGAGKAKQVARTRAGKDIPLSHIRRGRLPLLIAAIAGISALALGGVAQGGVTPTPDATIKAKGGGRNLHWGPSPIEVPDGGYLRIANKTEEPHTFSLVTQDEIPHKPRQFGKCYDKDPIGICHLIIKAHNQAKPGPGFGKTVDNGIIGPDQPVYDTAFETPDTDGDSLFLGHNARLAQVDATPNQTLFFMCVIHPWMHAKVNVTTP